MYWIGLQPGDMHLNISSPGWAKHAYSCFFAPWNAGATVFIANQPRFNARGMLDAIAEQQGHHALRAADGLAHVRAGGPDALEDLAARGLLAPASRCNPEVIEHVQKVWDLTVRDGYGQTETTPQIGNFARPDGETRLDGPGSAGLPHPPAGCRRPGGGGRRGLHRAGSAHRPG